MTGLSLGLGTKLNDIAIHFTTNRVGSAECPLIAKSGHSTFQVGDKVWGIAVGLLEFEGRVEQGGAGFRHIVVWL